jgi:hypothetical protein
MCDDNDDLRPEYDLSQRARAGKRGKYADRFRDGPVSLPHDSDAHLDDGEESFHLTDEMKAELELSIAQADRGEGTPADEVLAELRARTALRPQRDDA